MKKLCLLLLALLLPLCARADAARDVTWEVKLEAPSYATTGVENLRDEDENTGYAVPGTHKQYLYVTPGQDAVAAVNVEFGLAFSRFEVQAQSAGEWQTVAACENPGFAQVSLTFPPQSERFRFRFYPLDRGADLSVRELRLYSEGELAPGLLYDWQPPTEKADILFLAAHPDDELLWFGGAIPSCADAARSVQVAYLTCGSAQRRLELLNGLRCCGVRNYPDIGRLKDMTGTRAQVLDTWGRQTALNRLVRLLRRYQPEVVVTHGVKGEYGHIQHMLCSQLLTEAVPLAADPSYLKKEGPVWQVKKVYLHGGEEPTTFMNWDAPLPSLNGITGMEAAQRAFLMHRSQNHEKFSVAQPGDRNDSTLYTLTITTVGPDVLGGDFFENIPADCLQ